MLFTSRLINRFLVFSGRRKFAKYGRGSLWVPLQSRIVDPSLVSVGDNVFIGPGAHISARLIIMDNVMFGPNVCIAGGNHKFGEIGRLNRFLKRPPDSEEVIVIEEDSWIGANVILLPKVRVGFGSVVGAGSVVTRNVAPFTVVAGNPARVLRSIFSKSDVRIHLKSLGKDDLFINNILERL